MPSSIPSVRRRVAVLALATLAALGLPATGRAADLIKIVVPYSPGGGVDQVTRALTPKLGQLLGRTVIVDNRPGAATNLGTEAVVRSTPDGDTLLTASNTLASNGALFPKLSFNPATDLVPVGAIGKAALVVVVNASAPYQTLAQLIADGKAHPDRLSYGSAGNGSSGHLACELLKDDANIQAVHVPYKGGSAAVADLLGGQLNLMCINPIEVISHIKAGKLRALAIMDGQASPLLPGVPTVASLGLPNATATVWWGLVGPKGMPADKVHALDAALQKALADPETVKNLSDRGVNVTPMSAERFGQFVAAERTKWTRVIKAAHIQAD